MILGAGGHAKVLIDCLLVWQQADIEAALDPDPAKWGKNLLGVPILGGDDRLGELSARGVTHFVVGVGGTGDNRPRQSLFELAASTGLVPLTVVHPSAVVSRFAVLGAGCQVLPGAIVNAGARLGVSVIVNSGAIVEHDCVIGDHVHIATGARLASTVVVGVLAHIGVGAAIRQCASIGEGAVVGAGAAVVAEVAPWTIVAGVPARPLAQSR